MSCMYLSEMIRLLSHAMNTSGDIPVAICDHHGNLLWNSKGVDVVSQECIDEHEQVESIPVHVVIRCEGLFKQER